METQRLVLRMFRESDTDAYADMVADPEVMRFLGGGKPVPRAEAWRNMAMILGHWHLRGYGFWAVEARRETRGRVGSLRDEGDRLRRRARGVVGPGVTYMPRRIHFIERNRAFKKLEGNIHESWCWEMTPQTAESLVGGDIYFHIKQKEPSYFGGKVLAYRIHDGSGGEQPDCHGRVVFTFEFTRGHRGVSAGEGGWAFMKKIV